MKGFAIKSHLLRIVFLGVGLPVLISPLRAAPPVPVWSQPLVASRSLTMSRLPTVVEAEMETNFDFRCVVKARDAKPVKAQAVEVAETKCCSV